MIGHAIEPGVILVGLLVGIFIGISGVGGGSLMTPLLIIVMGMHPAIAIGTDLVYSVPTKIVGAITHARGKTVDWNLARWLAVGGVPGALVGVATLFILQRRVSLTAFNLLLRHAVGIALLLAAAALVVKLVIGMRSAKLPVVDETGWDGKGTAKVATLGFFVGFFVSLTSIGSGAMTLPALFALLPAVGLRRLVGSDVAFAAVLLPVAALGALALGNVNIPLALNLVLGSIPGVIVGSRLCRALPERWLRPGVAAVLVFAGTRLL